MKLIIESEGEHFEFEAEAAYIALMQPKDRKGDTMLMVAGKESAIGLIRGVATTLSSFLRSLTKGDEGEQNKLWKRFKEEYKSAKYTSSFHAVREEATPIKEE